jgi:hypothetical protein
VGFLLRAGHNKIQQRQSPRSIMATPNTNRSARPAQPRSASRLPINVDLLAIGIALALAALIRFGVIHQINF